MTTPPVTLYGYVPYGELPDMSPFVAKVQDYLDLAGIPYAKQLGDIRKAPRNKLPFIEYQGRQITDSAAIISALEAAELGATLDAELDPEQRAELTALASMLELELYFIVAWMRWAYEPGWQVYKDAVGRFFVETGMAGFLIPMLRGFIRKQFVRALHGQGVGRREFDENLARVRELFDALEVLEARHEGPFWFGAAPTSADAMAHAFVATTVKAELGVGCEGLLDDRPGLRAWFEHVDGVLAERRGAS